MTGIASRPANGLRVRDPARRPCRAAQPRTEGTGGSRRDAPVPMTHKLLPSRTQPAHNALAQAGIQPLEHCPNSLFRPALLSAPTAPVANWLQAVGRGMEWVRLHLAPPPSCCKFLSSQFPDFPSMSVLFVVLRVVDVVAVAVVVVGSCRRGRSPCCYLRSTDRTRNT